MHTAYSTARKGSDIMKIYIDTREKKTAIKDILKRFDELGIDYEFKQLKTGDYMNVEDENSKELHIIIDRKSGLDELAYNLGVDRVRFHKELKRAKDNHIHLIILIADEHRTTLNDVLDWKPCYSTIDGKMLLRLMQQAILYYGEAVYFQFCKPDEMADEIVRTLSFCR